MRERASRKNAKTMVNKIRASVGATRKKTAIFEKAGKDRGTGIERDEKRKLEYRKQKDCEDGISLSKP